MTETNIGFVYLAEFIGEDNNWEWYDVYDPNKHNLIGIFESYLSDFLGEPVTIEEGDLKVEGGFTIHKEYDFRVWKVNI